MLSPDGDGVQFFVGPDKNPSMVKREVMSKAIFNSISKAHPNAKFFLRKATGTILSDRRHVVSVIITGPYTGSLDWNLSKVAELEIVKDNFDEEFKLLVSADGGSSS